MNTYEEVYQKLKEKYTDAEIAEGFMIPASMTDEEKKISDEAFRKIRFELLNKRTEKQRVVSEVIRLRIKIRKYLAEEIYIEDFNFGAILSEYISLIGRTKKEFSEDIDVHYSRLSRILNDKEDPNLSLIYRLEQHADELIPAVSWWKLMIRKQEFLITSDQAQRDVEKQHVKNILKASA